MNPFRRPLIAGNWKMNAGGQEACVLANAVAEKTRRADRVDVVVAPPFTAIAAVAHEIEETRGSIDVDEGFGVGVAAQNMHHLASGAFTGEISAPMLRDAGATWVILGHSERRQHFHETDHGVALKAKAALEAELRPIVCVGETLAVIERQVRAFMAHFAESQMCIRDSNQKAMYDDGHLPGAKHLPIDDIKESDLAPDKNAELLFYCSNEK